MNNNLLSTPISIVLAGIIIAGSIIYTGGIGSSSGFGGGNQAALVNDGGSNNNEVAPSTGAPENIKPVDNNDHIRGNADAQVVIVEFSDMQCPFCKGFHSTMQQVLSSYPDNQVAWAYRHFPLDSIHPRARKEAEASECAAELGGNDAFWRFVDAVFTREPSINLAQLPDIAAQIGLNKGEFEQCLNSGRYAEEVTKDLNDATHSGGRGTPYSIAITKSGDKFVISGAQSLETIKQIIDSAIGTN